MRASSLSSATIIGLSLIWALVAVRGESPKHDKVVNLAVESPDSVRRGEIEGQLAELEKENNDQQRHHCIHDSPELQSTLFHSGMDIHAPQPPLQQQGGKEERGRKRRQETQTHGEHQFQSQSTTFTGPLRITMSTLDLDDGTKYCTAVGDVRPTFIGSSSTTCTEEDILTTDKKNILINNVLPLAQAQLYNALNVAQLTNNLIVPSTLCTSVNKNAADTTTGVASDFHLYVTAGPTTGTTIAWAGYCALDGTSNRPIAGHANFSPKYLVWNESRAAENELLVATAVHELLHALGFTSNFYSNYFPQTATKTTTLRNKAVTLIQTPNVVAAARTFFNCGELEGLELEDQGGSGSALSHWDRRVMKDEIMAAAGGLYLSSVTLGYMLDSGVYGVNSDRAETMTFGAGAGCSFVTSLCNTAAGGNGKYWCFQQSASLCTPDYQAVGVCAVFTNTADVPAVYQYFTDPKLGGSEFQDYCPSIQAATSYTCTNGNLTGLNGNDAIFGHYFGTGGRCVTTSGLIQSGFSATGTDSGLRCIKSRCLNGAVVELNVGDSWLSCPSDGSAGTITAPSGWSGTLNCPAAADFCGGDINYGIIVATPNPPTWTAGSITTESTTTAATATTPSTPAPSTLVPLGTTASTPVPPTPIPPTPAIYVYTLQYASSLAVFQYTADRQVNVRVQIAAALLIDFSAVTLDQITAGETNSQYEGATIIRFSVQSPSSTSSTALSSVSSTLQNTSSTLSTLTQPVGNSLQLVTDCSTVCSAEGSVSSYRNIANTECVCVCENSWNGTTCSSCPSQYNETNDCASCAEGLTGYPSCSTGTGCTSPQNRSVVVLSNACERIVFSQLSYSRIACNQVHCLCKGGTWSNAECILTSEPSNCAKWVCLGKLRECLYQEQYSLMQSQSSSCTATDNSRFESYGRNQRDWCVFDGCISSTFSQCSDSEKTSACSVYGERIINGAETPFRRSGGGTIIVLTLVVTLLSSLIL